MLIIKCVVIGDGGVGKTCLLITCATKTFPKECVPTLFDNYAVTVQIDSAPYTIGFYDTSGQEDYDKLRPKIYPGTDIFLICFSIVNPSSLSNVEEKWLPELQNEGLRNVPYLLIGTQVDLRNDSETIAELAKVNEEPVTKEMGETVARRINAAKYLECSALTQNGLTDVLDEAILIALNPPVIPDSKCCRCCIL